MRILVPILMAFFTALPAQATPPQAISVDETLEAIGGGYLFVSRRLTDNMASYDRQQVDVVLIARDTRSNQDVYLWPLSCRLDNGAEHIETSDHPRHVTLPLDPVHKLWQIISTHHGGYPNQHKATEESAIAVLRNQDGMLITAKTPSFAYETPAGTADRTSYWLSYATLGRLFTDSLRATRYGFEPYYIASDDPLTAPNFDPQQDCSIGYFAELSQQTDGPQQGFWVAYVTCENEHLMAPISMFITLQALR